MLGLTNHWSKKVESGHSIDVRMCIYDSLFKPLAILACCAIVLAGAAGKLLGASSAPVETSAVETNIVQLTALISGSNRVEVAVDLVGEILWVDTAQEQIYLQTDAGVLRVRNLIDQPVLGLGQRIRLTGHGLAGQGFLDRFGKALVDNDGLHSLAEKSGTVYLTAGRHPLRAEWFNASGTFSFSVEYAGPNLPRQLIPDRVLYRMETNGADSAPRWVPGLNYRCDEGLWERLPSGRELAPAKTGKVTNFDLNVRARDEFIALQFTGYLQVDESGVYTFWTKSDDGSRLFIEADPLRLEILDSHPLPTPQVILPGQALKSGEDCFWAVTEGVVTGIHFEKSGALELELCSGADRIYLVSSAADFSVPDLFSRIRATGLCRSVPVAGGGRIAGRLLVSSASQVETLAVAPVSATFAATNLAELRHLAEGSPRAGMPVCLTGTVVTAISPQGCFAFQDETGGVIVQVDGASDWLKPGLQIILKGYGILDGNKLALNHAALVNDNGVHSFEEASGSAYLTAGRHPFHLSWFNQGGGSGLKVFYQGPGLSRRDVPGSALFYPKLKMPGGDMKWVSGLHYTIYNGDWGRVPEVSELDPVATGTTDNFKLRLANRPEQVGLEFSGFLNVPKAGQYFFTVFSDDGSLFFIDEQALQIRQISIQSPPEPTAIFPRQILEPDQNNRWSVTEGIVNFVSERDGSLFLDLDSVYGSMRVEIVDGSDGSTLLLLGARVRVQGFCQSARVPDGQSLAATMVVPDVKQVQLLEPDLRQWSRYALKPIGTAFQQTFLPKDETIIHIQGEGRVDPATRNLILTDESGSIMVETAQPLPANLTGTVEAIGRLSRTETNVLLQCGIYRPLAGSTDGKTHKLPLLTTVQQVKQLTREEASRRYPVKVRGIVTLVRVNGSGVIIQDDASAIDVWWAPHSIDAVPKIGDYWEIEGETSVMFSPIIQSRRAVCLSPGFMPEPLHPAWDQLINGSLDTRYVEIQGIVTAMEADAVTLFTREGIVRVLLSPAPAEPFNRYLNALVRIRGCLVPTRDEHQQIRMGEFRLSNMSLNVDEPAPSDLFGVGLKHISDLLLFDAQAAAFQRVKIAGQILHQRNNEFYLMDGPNVIRVTSREPVDLQVGDLVEAVGFPQLKGRTPILQEAVFRRTGKASLPAPRRIPGNLLFANGDDYDGRLVSVEARLIAVTSDLWENVLELQVGNREFLARIEKRGGTMTNPKLGSWVELTGIYSEQGLRSASGKTLGSFELLLDSPSALKVLKQPPWWTVQRALSFIGGMAFVIVATMVWIILLRRQVERRSVQLKKEMQLRERFQRQNELEKERGRIARDMHDQLGASVTQVGLLAELARKNVGDPEKIIANTDRISRTALELGQSLDEIVWAVNPKNDSLNKFCDYMAVHAQELFQLTNILCRVDLPPEMPYYPLCAEVRHNLFLAVKEALNNIVRHAHAREVWMRFMLEETRFQISITDDGAGFVPDQMPSLRNGLQNMKKRIEDVGGTFTITSQQNQGTKVTLTIGFDQMTEKTYGKF